MPKTKAAALPRKISEKKLEPVTTPFPTLAVIFVILLAERDPYSAPLPAICAPKTRTNEKPTMAATDAINTARTVFTDKAALCHTGHQLPVSRADREYKTIGLRFCQVLGCLKGCKKSVVVKNLSWLYYRSYALLVHWRL